MTLTLSRLHELLHYDPLTGIFTRLTKVGGQPVGSVAGHLNTNGYIELRVDGKSYVGHRLAWFYIYGRWPAGKLDHRDTVRSHNWITNLRPVTDQQNAQNTNAHRDSKTGIKGVSIQTKTGRFRATIRVNGKQKHLGYFATTEQASTVYEQAAAEQYGEYYRARASSRPDQRSG